jgi:hypothetical protein
MSRTLLPDLLRRARPRRTIAMGALATTVASAVALATADAPKSVGDAPWHTIDGGGGRSAAGALVLSGTAGQPDAGAMSGGSYALAGGFWHGGQTATGVGEGPEVPGAAALPLRFQLHPVHPNPFNPTTTIAFDLPAPERVLLRVYNLRGERVATVLDAQRAAGRYRVQWRGQDDRGVAVASGVYVVTLQAGESQAHQKIALVR